MFKACFNWITTKLKYLCCCFTPEPEYQFTPMEMTTSKKGSPNKGKNKSENPFYIGTPTQKRVKETLKKSGERRKQEERKEVTKSILSFFSPNSDSECTTSDGCSAQELLERKQKEAADSSLSPGKLKQKVKKAKSIFREGGELNASLPGVKKKVGFSINKI